MHGNRRPQLLPCSPHRSRTHHPAVLKVHAVFTAAPGPCMPGPTPPSSTFAHLLAVLTAAPGPCMPGPPPTVFYLRPLPRRATATLASLMFLQHAEHRPASGPSHLLFLLLGCSSSKLFEDSFPSPLRASNLSPVKYGATLHILQGGGLCGFDETNSEQERGACPSSPAQVIGRIPQIQSPPNQVASSSDSQLGEGCPRDTW